MQYYNLMMQQNGEMFQGDARRNQFDMNNMRGQ